MKKGFDLCVLFLMVLMVLIMLVIGLINFWYIGVLVFLRLGCLDLVERWMNLEIFVYFFRVSLVCLVIGLLIFLLSLIYFLIWLVMNVLKFFICLGSFFFIGVVGFGVGGGGGGGVRVLIKGVGVEFWGVVVDDGFWGVWVVVDLRLIVDCVMFFRCEVVVFSLCNNIVRGV